MSRINVERLKLELARSRRPALLYLYLLAVSAFALGIVLKNQFYNRFWESKYTFKAQFADVKGVTPGAQRVKIAGVTVGVVTASKVVNGRAVLTMQLKKQYGPIYRDAKLRLRPLTPLEDMYVDIESRGHRRAGELGSTALAAQHTVSPVDISRVLNEFPSSTRTRMQILLGQLGRGLDGNGEQLRWAFGELTPFLRAAQRTTAVVSQRRTQTARLVTNLHLLTKALSARDGQLRTLVLAGNSSLGALAGADRQLDATFAQIPGTLDAVRAGFTELRRAEDELDPAITSLDPVAGKLRAGMSALSALAAEATPTLQDLRPAVTQLDPLAADLRPTASALRGALTQLRDQAPQYNRITEQLPPCFPRIGPFFNDTLSVFKFSDASGAYPRGNDSEDADTVGGVAPLGATGQKRVVPCTEGGR